MTRFDDLKCFSKWVSCIEEECGYPEDVLTMSQYAITIKSCIKHM